MTCLPPTETQSSTSNDHTSNRMITVESNKAEDERISSNPLAALKEKDIVFPETSSREDDNDKVLLDIEEPKKTLYGKEYVPKEKDVIVGRGKKCFNHSGNKELRRIVASRLDEYSSSSCKLDKSYILSSIVDQIRVNGGFIKKDPKTGLWYDVGDILAKEKLSQTFRDALHEKYKSSTAFKRKRRQEKKATYQQKQAGYGSGYYTQETASFQQYYSRNIELLSSPLFLNDQQPNNNNNVENMMYPLPQPKQQVQQQQRPRHQHHQQQHQHQHQHQHHHQHPQQERRQEQNPYFSSSLSQSLTVLDLESASSHDVSFDVVERLSHSLPDLHFEAENNGDDDPFQPIPIAEAFVGEETAPAPPPPTSATMRNRRSRSSLSLTTTGTISQHQQLPMPTMNNERIKRSSFRFEDDDDSFDPFRVPSLSATKSRPNQSGDCYEPIELLDPFD